MATPEAQARQHIDELLSAAGWHIQGRDQIDLGAARGVAVREFPLRTGFADYLLFVNRKAISAVEAKPVGTPLSGVEAQSEKYGAGLPNIPPAWHRPLPFLYESTGVETFFTDGRDPQPRSRRVFAFHQPATLLAWATDVGATDVGATDVGATVVGATDLWRGVLSRPVPDRHAVGQLSRRRDRRLIGTPSCWVLIPAFLATVMKPDTNSDAPIRCHLVTDREHESSLTTARVAQLKAMIRIASTRCSDFTARQGSMR
jgi:hypothetical protein